MPSDLTDLSSGEHVDPYSTKPTNENIGRYSNPPFGNKKRQKKILCIVLTAVRGAMPTLVAKPKKKKYGNRWFSANNGTYFINYKALIDVGKHYLYMTTEDNAVGACYLAEHMEFADSNQVEMMTNQHTVEVFKKNKGISQKLVLMIVVALMVSVLIIAVTVVTLIGMNGTVVNQKNQITSLQSENTKLKEQMGGIIH